jgi:hypothetical protein
MSTVELAKSRTLRREQKGRATFSAFINSPKGAKAITRCDWCMSGSAGKVNVARCSRPAKKAGQRLYAAPDEKTIAYLYKQKHGNLQVKDIVQSLLVIPENRDRFFRRRFSLFAALHQWCFPFVREPAYRPAGMSTDKRVGAPSFLWLFPEPHLS